MTLVNEFNRYFSKQAKLAVLGYALLAVAFFLPVKDPANPNKEYNLTERALSFFVILLPMAVSVYTINCMVKGTANGGMPCNVLAWLNGLSVLVWSVLVLGFTLMLLNSSNVVVTEKYAGCRSDDE